MPVPGIIDENNTLKRAHPRRTSIQSKYPPPSQVENIQSLSNKVLSEEKSSQKKKGTDNVHCINVFDKEGNEQTSCSHASSSQHVVCCSFNWAKATSLFWFAALDSLSSSLVILFVSF